jgi:endogenous inhibitor of DNA gyrase (YacG/DUF329 family)
MKMKKGKQSQCAHCGKTFKVKREDAFMFCKKSCERAHDLFSGRIWYERCL